MLLALALIVDVCVASSVACVLLTTFMPLWGALLLGIPLGFAAFILVMSVLFKRAAVMDYMLAHAVVAIVGTLAVLTALLYPFALRARSAARSTDCLSHMKILGRGVLLYAQDWDGTFPPADRWADAAADKVKPDEASTAFHCPEDSSAYSYAFNLTLDRRAVPGPATAGQMILLFEANVRARNAVGDSIQPAHPARHSGANNYLFADGHARSVKPAIEPWRSIMRPGMR